MGLYNLGGVSGLLYIGSNGILVVPDARKVLGSKNRLPANLEYLTKTALSAYMVQLLMQLSLTGLKRYLPTVPIPAIG